jgi:O-antigen/teichoic acid export membrane protein
LFIAAALRFVTSTLGQGLFASHQQRFFLRSFLVTMVLNLALNLALDSSLGAVGPGIALVCTELVGLVINSRWLHRQCGYRTPVRFLLRVLVPTALSVAVAVLLSGQHVVLVVTAAAVTYLAASMVIGPVKWSTLTSMRGKQVMA